MDYNAKYISKSTLIGDLKILRKLLNKKEDWEYKFLERTYYELYQEILSNEKNFVSFIRQMRFDPDDYVPIIQFVKN